MAATPSPYPTPQTAGVPHPARPCPFQSPKRALVAASLCLPSGFAARRSAADSTPAALFHPFAPLSAPQVPTEAMNSGPFRLRAFRSRLLDKSDQGLSSSDELKQESALVSAIGKSPNMAK